MNLWNPGLQAGGEVITRTLYANDFRGQGNGRISPPRRPEPGAAWNLRNGVIYVGLEAICVEHLRRQAGRVDALTGSMNATDTISRR